MAVLCDSGSAVSLLMDGCDVDDNGDRQALLVPVPRVSGGNEQAADLFSRHEGHWFKAKATQDWRMH